MPSIPSLVRRGLCALAAALAAVMLSANPAAAAGPPNSMASMGDSITRGFNACGWYVDCTARSFSTGNYSSRQQPLPAHPGQEPGDQRPQLQRRPQSGAKAADMPGQAATAVGRNVEYVTMLIGANDACTS